MKFLNVIIVLLVTVTLQAQVIPLTPDAQAYREIDRLALRLGFKSTTLHTSHKYYSREDILALLHEARHQDIPIDSFAFRYLIDDLDESHGTLATHFMNHSEPNVENPSTSLQQKNELPDSANAFLPKRNNKPLFGFLYRTPGSMIAVDAPMFYLRAEPVIHFGYGRSSGDQSANVFSNTRGIDLRGGIEDKVFFQSRIEESQMGFPDYVDTYINSHRAIPGAGLYKTYKSSVSSLSGYDFLNAQGLIGFHVLKPITLQFGHGRNFIGDGIRSLFLSDFSANYLYLKLNTKVWIFDYQNLWCQLQSTSHVNGDTLIPKKYLAMHHLSLNLTSWLNIGLFESVIFSRENQFEFQYLNPVIFYRSVEHLLGSPDNASLGIDFKADIAHTAQIYGQWFLDELKIKDLIKNTGWWGNKNGFQLGFKYFDVASIDHLDLQCEINRVRPYTYTHNTLETNYSHYGQALAHPLEANFTEYLARVSWRPLSRLFVSSQFMFARKGENLSDTMNYGGNIFLPYQSRTADYGVRQLQGILSKRTMLGINVSYMWYHNMYVDLSLLLRNYSTKENVIPARNERIFSLGLRINFDRPDLFL